MIASKYAEVVRRNRLGLRFVDTLEAAAIADRCPETIRRWARAGTLRVYRPRHNNRMYFKPDAVRRRVQIEEYEV